MLKFIVLGQIPGLHYTITFTTYLFITLLVCGFICYQMTLREIKALRQQPTRQIIYRLWL